MNGLLESCCLPLEIKQCRGICEHTRNTRKTPFLFFFFFLMLISAPIFTSTKLIPGVLIGDAGSLLIHTMNIPVYFNEQYVMKFLEIRLDSSGRHDCGLQMTWSLNGLGLSLR